MIKNRTLSKQYKPQTTINGGKCTENSRVGYCWSNLHKGYLTQKLMKEHECCEKNCPHFEKFENAPYWQRKANAKIEKRFARAQQKQEKELLQRVLDSAREATQHDDNFYAISAEMGKAKNKYDVCVIRYISFSSINIRSYSKMLQKACGVPIHVQEIKTTRNKKLDILKVHKLIS